MHTIDTAKYIVASALGSAGDRLRNAGARVHHSVPVAVRTEDVTRAAVAAWHIGVRDGRRVTTGRA